MTLVTLTGDCPAFMDVSKLRYGMASCFKKSRAIQLKRSRPRQVASRTVAPSRAAVIREAIGPPPSDNVRWLVETSSPSPRQTVDPGIDKIKRNKIQSTDFRFHCRLSCFMKHNNSISNAIIFRQIHKSILKKIFYFLLF